jgi:predicted MFS family arabinose efflux permease
MQMKSNIGAVALQPAWNAVFGVALGVAGLVTSEFLPISLLTPMAKDLGVTEGVAGQAISVTAVVAMLASLFTAVVTQRLNRRWVLLAFCMLQMIANLAVAYAPNFALLLIARVLLGTGIGGFWGMAVAVTIRLVPEELVPKALSVVFGAVSVAAVVAAPLGSYLGAHIGWRNIFLFAAAIGGMAFIWQAATLPSMPVDSPTRLGALWNVLKRPGIKGGMLATMVVHIGYAAFFTYLRPFLERVTGVSTDILSAVLLGFGVANFVGTTLARFLLNWNLYRTLALMPLLLVVLLGGLVVFGYIPVVAAILVGLWGMVFGVVQVGWMAWLARTAPDEAESGGAVQIGSIQLAIMAGAGIGGVFFDHVGTRSVFLTAGVFTLVAAMVAGLAFRGRKLYRWVA